MFVEGKGGGGKYRSRIGRRLKGHSRLLCSPTTIALPRIATRNVFEHSTAGVILRISGSNVEVPSKPKRYLGSAAGIKMTREEIDIERESVRALSRCTPRYRNTAPISLAIVRRRPFGRKRARIRLEKCGGRGREIPSPDVGPITYFFLHLVDGSGFPDPHGIVLEEGAIQIHLQFGADLFLVETRQRTDPGLQNEHRHHHEDVLCRRRTNEIRVG